MAKLKINLIPDGSVGTRSSARPKRYVWLIPAVVGLMIAGILLARDYPRSVKNINTLAERRVLVALGRVEQSLGMLFLGLDVLNRKIRAEGADWRIERSYLNQLRNDLPYVRTLIAVAPDGDVRADMRPGEPAVGMNVADRSYFKAHVGAMSFEAKLSAPVNSRLDGRSTLPISSAVYSDDGQLLAVVVASVEPEYFGMVDDATIASSGEGIYLFERSQNLLVRLDKMDFQPAAPPEVLETLKTAISENADNKQETVITTTSDEYALSVASALNWSIEVALVQTQKTIRGAVFAAAIPPSAAILFSGLIFSIWMFLARRRRDFISAKAAELQTLNDRLEMAMSGGRVGVWDWDIKSNALYWSPVLMDMIGLKEDEFVPVASSFFERVVPEHEAGVKAALDAHLAGQSSFDVSFDIFGRNGERISVVSRGEAVRDRFGRPQRMLGILRDVSQQRSLESRLLEAERVAQIGHWSYDVRLEKLLWSPETYRLHGLEPYEVEPDINSALAFYLPDDRKSLREAVENAMQLGHPYEFDARIRRIDGSVRFIRTSGKVTYDAQGNVARLFGIMQDRSEVVIKEQQLRAVQRHEAFGQLASGIAHDFNNIMAVILGNLQLLEEDEAGRMNAESRFLLEEATQALVRGRDLTKSLLNFARTAPLNPERVAPREAVDTLVELIRRTFPASIDVEVTGHVGDWTIHVDRSDLDACLLNIAINARDAMGQSGRLRIDVALVSEHRELDPCNAQLNDNVFARFRFCDTGAGIAPENLPFVFEPFFSLKPSGEGSGLGLSRVKGFVEQSGGTVKIDSTPGKGTMLDLCLPATSATGTDKQLDVRLTLDLPSDLRVLIVEDMEDVRRFLQKRFERLGFRVDTAVNGDQAARILAGGAKYDLLVTDIVMPGRYNGSEIAALARRHLPDLKVILIYGYVEAAAIEGARVSPEDIWLMKPISADDLYKALNEAFYD